MTRPTPNALVEIIAMAMAWSPGAVVDPIAYWQLELEPSRRRFRADAREFLQLQWSGEMSEKFLEEFMDVGEAERLESAVINAALDWTAAKRHGAPPPRIIEVEAALYNACRELHIAREEAFAKKIMSTGKGGA